MSANLEAKKQIVEDIKAKMLEIAVDGEVGENDQVYKAVPDNCRFVLWKNYIFAQPEFTDL